MEVRFALTIIMVTFLSTSSWAGTIEGTVSLFGKARMNAAVHLVGIMKNVSPPEKHPVMVQKAQLFIPAVLPVIRGSTVDFPNKDTVFHHLASLSKVNAFNFGRYAPGKTVKVRFKKAGRVDIFCNVHQQMHSIVLVLKHPYYTLTSKKGIYEINDVPEGKYRIKAWASPARFKEMNVVVSSSNPVRVDFEIGTED